MKKRFLMVLILVGTFVGVGCEYYKLDGLQTLDQRKEVVDGGEKEKSPYRKLNCTEEQEQEINELNGYVQELNQDIAAKSPPTPLLQTYGYAGGGSYAAETCDDLIQALNDQIDGLKVECTNDQLAHLEKLEKSVSNFDKKTMGKFVNDSGCVKDLPDEACDEKIQALEEQIECLRKKAASERSAGVENMLRGIKAPSPSDSHYRYDSNNTRPIRAKELF